MKPTPRISDTEWEIMKLCWASSPRTAQDIIDELSSSDDWHPKTVKTFLNRLVKKGALGFEKEGRIYLYRPLVTERECVAAASESFLDRIFGGSLKPMLAHFVEHRKLSKEELAELRRMLKEK
ncbi:MAG: BlaI/MecI/CopY family transcriptional regulator [Verrucomicrobiales bacterium]|nr:BlaI/MecI/CopY family transcriptional regulator [Verrucomicrobiales bacterium]